MNCPLCDSQKLRKIVMIDKNELIKKYNNYLKQDFSYLIYDDISYNECLDCKLRFFKPLITGDENFYKALQQFEWYYSDEKNEYNVAKKYIQPDDSVLEVGCGKGAFKKFIPDNNYVGLEFSKSAKELAKKSNIKIKNKSVEEYAKKHPKEFDVVVSFQVLEHVENPTSFIESKIKLLKKNGILIISVPAEDSFLKFVTNGLLNMPPHHVTRWSNKTLKYLAKKYQLELLDIEHEELQEVHKINYMQTLVRNSLCNSKLIQSNVDDQEFVNSLASMLAKGLKREMLPRGHTVTAIYRK